MATQANPLASQIDEARKNGYSDDEIAGYLSKSHPELAPKISEAQQAGFKASDIVGHLAAPGAPTQPVQYGPLANYLRGHFPNVAHYLGVSDVTPEEQKHFETASSDVDSFRNQHPVINGILENSLPGPIPMEVPNSVAVPGAATPILKAMGRGAGDIADSPLGKLVLPYRWRMGLQVLSDYAGKEQTPQLFDDLARSLAGKKYSELSEAQQAAIKAAAKGIRPVTTPGSNPVPATTMLSNEPSLPADELMRRAIADKTPGQVLPAGSPNTPGPVRPPLATPAPPAPAVPASPVAGAPLRPPLATSAGPIMEAPTASAPAPFNAEGVTREISPPEAANRQVAARNIADYLMEKGIPAKDLDLLEENSAAKKSFWDAAGAAGHRPGYTPSKDTIDAVKTILTARDVATRPPPTAPVPPVGSHLPPAARSIAQQLLEEINGALGPTPIGGITGGK